MNTVLAVDVGGTSIKAAVLDASGRTVRGRDVPTPAADGPAAVVAAIRAVVGELAGPDLAAAGVVVPGVVDAGVARYSTNLGWRDVPLAALLGDDLAVPVALDHDVRAAGLAERTLGAAAGIDDCAIVIIGTGIAAVLVVSGAPVAGATRTAGELGHLPVRPDGELCACGQRGCTEVYASAAGIARRYAVATGSSLDAAGVVAAADRDPIAGRVWAEAVDALAIALTSTTMLLDPALIVLGGGLSAAGAPLRDRVAAALAQRLAWRSAPDVTLSPLAGRAGQWGAGLLAHQAAGGDLADVAGRWRAAARR